jgi:hypothetical protein
MFSLDPAIFIAVTYHSTVNWLRYLLVNTVLPSRFEIHQQFTNKARGMRPMTPNLTDCMPTPDVFLMILGVEGGYVLNFLEEVA